MSQNVNVKWVDYKLSAATFSLLIKGGTDWAWSVYLHDGNGKRLVFGPVAFSFERTQSDEKMFKCGATFARQWALRFFLERQQPASGNHAMRY